MRVAVVAGRGEGRGSNKSKRDPGDHVSWQAKHKMT